MEKKQNYVTKVQEECVAQFIKNDKPIVKYLFVSGPGDLKNQFFKDADFDPRLKKLVV